MMKSWFFLFSIFFSLLATEVFAGTPWPQLGRTPDRHNYTPDHLKPDTKTIWQLDLLKVNPKHRLSPTAQVLVVDGKGWIGCKDGAVICMDAKNGKLLWDSSAGGGILHTIAWHKDKIYSATMAGEVVSMDAKSGKVIKKFSTGKRYGFSTAVLIANDTLYAVDRGGYLYGLSLPDLSKKWEYYAEAPVMHSPTYGHGNVYFGDELVRGHAVDAKSGKRKWMSKQMGVGVSFIEYYPLVIDKYVLFRPMVKRNSKEKSFYLFEGKTGKAGPEFEHYTFLMGGPHSPPAVTKDKKMCVPWEIFVNDNKHDHSRRGWALQDINGKASPMLPKMMHKKDTIGLGRGAIDETMACSVLGETIVVLHHYGPAWGNPAQLQNGIYHIPTKQWYKIRRPSQLGALKCTQGGGSVAASASGGIMYHQAESLIYAMGPKN